MGFSMVPKLFYLNGQCSAHVEGLGMAMGVIEPFREESRGRMSKMSTLSILPRISRRSRPVDCSISVGTVPGFAPGPTRSVLDFISVSQKTVRPSASVRPREA